MKAYENKPDYWQNSGQREILGNRELWKHGTLNEIGEPGNSGKSGSSGKRGHREKMSTWKFWGINPIKKSMTKDVQFCIDFSTQVGSFFHDFLTPRNLAKNFSSPVFL